MRSHNGSSVVTLGMWKFVTASDSDGNPFLRSLNNNIGRQIWVYDPDAGTQEERDEVEAARQAFSRNRHNVKDSGDLLLRLQASKKARDKGPFNVDKASLPKPALLSDAKVVSEGMPRATVEAALKNGVSFYETLQAEDGHWPGDYGGPMFLMPGLIITCYVTGVLDSALSPEHKREMIRYLRNHQNRDGGFGLHIEGGSTMFGTVLSYVSLRILGVSSDDDAVEAARAWMHARGGAHSTASWGKFWLAVLGVYSWDGMNPMPPEMWLLPYSKWTGLGWAHPGRFWCHCRMVYLPMSYVYGKRGTCKMTPLVAEIKQELYPIPYDEIDWNAARNLIAKEDLYYPHPLIQDVLWWTLSKAERFLVGSKLRALALRECMKHIHYEDENTRYICIGPVNKVSRYSSFANEKISMSVARPLQAFIIPSTSSCLLQTINMLACWLEDPESEAFKRHIPRLYDFLWVAEDGMKMQGYNGSQLWDTAFAVQAIHATGLSREFSTCLESAGAYIEASQVIEEAQEPLSEFYRHISKGAWPFSTRDHGWPISDCSSEGLKAALILAHLKKEVKGLNPPDISDHRLYDCVNVLLSYQNPEGGWATYENRRSTPLLEIINPSETFGDIVVDYCYVECSSACMTALDAFRKAYPQHRATEIQKSLDRGIRYIKSVQRKDGSWYGSWGVCFTYATWFGLEALAAMEEYATGGHHTSADRACEFLLSQQREDGGWGESYLSCQDKVYSQLEEDTSHAVNTGWALLGLIAAKYYEIDRRPLDAAAGFLIRIQESNGDWPMQHISGVFNRNCAITYANYRNIFPLWALGMYRSKVLGAR